MVISTNDDRRRLDATNDDRMCTYSNPHYYENYNLPIQIIFEPQSSDDIFDDVNSLIQMCKIGERIIDEDDMIWKYYEEEFKVCESRSLGNSVGVYFNKACSEITQIDADSFKTDLVACTELWNEGKLTFFPDSNTLADCAKTPNNDTLAYCLNPKCFKANIMYDVLNAVLPKDFPTSKKATYAKVIVMSSSYGYAAKQAHYQLLDMHSSRETFGDAIIVAYRSGDKMQIFTNQLLADNVFSGGAFIVVFLILWFHTTSGENGKTSRRPGETTIFTWTSLTTLPTHGPCRFYCAFWISADTLKPWCGLRDIHGRVLLTIFPLSQPCGNFCGRGDRGR